MKVAVIGGSLVGPALALMLQQCGIDTEVYEATPASVPQAGGVIGLDMPSMAALDGLGIQQSDIIPSTSEKVISVKVRDQKETGRIMEIWPGRHATWTLLHQALVEKLPDGTLHTGQKVVHLSTGDDNRARIHFAGDTVDADLVVFADGRKSTGRKILDPARKLSYAGVLGFRGWSGDPAPGGEYTRWQSGRTELHTAPIPSGTDWTFWTKASRDQFRTWFDGEPERKTFVVPGHLSPAATEAADLLAAEFTPPHIANLIHRTETRMMTPIMDIPEPDRMVWPVGSSYAVLVGDALAPVHPSTARGLNNGIDQAVGLTTMLNQVVNHHADLRACLTGWGGWQDRYLPRVVETLRSPDPAMGW